MPVHQRQLGSVYSRWKQYIFNLEKKPTVSGSTQERSCTVWLLVDSDCFVCSGLSCIVSVQITKIPGKLFETPIGFYIVSGGDGPNRRWLGTDDQDHSLIQTVAYVTTSQVLTHQRVLDCHHGLCVGECVLGRSSRKFHCGANNA